MGRRPLDAYETPPHYTRALADVIGLPKGGFYEPCVGQGHIIREFKRLGCRAGFDTNDIDPQYGDTHYDAADPASEAWGTLGYSWCITNPPFSQETAIAWNALRWCKRVAFLARLSFLEPTLERAELWSKHPPTGLIILPRYSFRLNDAGKKATDSMTCCWIIWEEGKPPCLTVSTRSTS